MRSMCHQSPKGLNVSRKSESKGDYCSSTKRGVFKGVFFAMAPRHKGRKGVRVIASFSRGCFLLCAGRDLRREDGTGIPNRGS